MNLSPLDAQVPWPWRILPGGKLVSVCGALFALLAWAHTAHGQGLREPVALWNFDNPVALGAASTGPNLQGIGDGFVSIRGFSGSDGAVLVQPGSFFFAPLVLSANGGGAYVNEYSIVCDFEADALLPRHAIYNSATDNTGGAEFFIYGREASVGPALYARSEPGSVARNTWYRLAISFGIENGVRVYRGYLNGRLAGELRGIPIDSRFSLCTDGTVFFGDGDGRDDPLTVSTLAVYDYALSADEAAALGGAGGADMPVDDPLAGAGFIYSRPAPQFCAEGVRVELVAPADWPCYRWFRDGEPLAESPRVSGTNARTLVFNPAQLEDSGVYACYCDEASAKARRTTLPYLFTVQPENEVPALDGAGLLHLLAALGLLACWKIGDVQRGR